jgi:membrane protease YdiL (CAAX protease family)
MSAPRSDPGQATAPRSLEVFITLATLVAMFAAVLIGVGGMMASQIGLIRVLGLRPTLLVSEALLATPAVLLSVAIGFRRDALGLKPVSWRSVLTSLAIGVSLWGMSLGLFELQYVFWKPAEGYLEGFRRLHEALRPSGPFDAVLSLLAIAVGPAVCEELLVRGAVLPQCWRALDACLPRLRGATNAVLAVVLSAIVFGAIHLDSYRFAFALVAGIVLGSLRARTGSLVPSMSAHALLNTITLVAAAFLDDPSQSMPDPRPGFGLFAFGAGAAATAMLFRFLPPALTQPRHAA